MDCRDWRGAFAVVQLQTVAAWAANSKAENYD